MYLTRFLFRRVWNKKVLYHHCFSTLLQNMPSGMTQKIKAGMESEI